MGKILRKLNRGAIVTAVVLLAVAVYLVALNIAQQKDQEEIKTTCEAFLLADADWRVLPVDYENGQTRLPEDQFNQFLADMKSDKAKYYVANQAALDNDLIYLNQTLTSQNEGMTALTTSFENKILKFSVISFDGDSVYVTVDTQVAIESRNFAAGETAPVRQSVNSSDSITLQKEDGTWKIVYAYINTVDMGGDGLIWKQQ